MDRTTTLTVRVAPATKLRLDAAARRLQRSESELAADAIEEFLAVQDWQATGIADAVASLDRGEGAAHADVEAWVKSWGSGDEKPPPA